MLKPVALGRTPSFEKVISILNQINLGIKKEELICYFKNYVFDFTEKKYLFLLLAFHKEMYIRLISFGDQLNHMVSISLTQMNRRALLHFFL